MEQKTKMTFEHFGTKFSVEFKDNEVDMYELFEAFKGLMIAAGYQNKSWENMINVLHSEITEPKKEFDMIKFLKEIDKRDECN